MVKDFFIIAFLSLLAVGCNKSVVSTNPVSTATTSSTSDLLLKQQSDEISALKTEIENLKSQKAQQPQVITKVVQNDSALKIEKCKAQWINNKDFPGTLDEFQKLLYQAQGTYNQVKAEDPNTDTSIDYFLKMLEESFRNSHYQDCLN